MSSPMTVTRTRAEIRAAAASYPSLGFVPTMGYLHEGHLSLVRAAKAQCDAVAVSIFVNPLQFSESEDLSTYPRDLDRDLGLLADEGVDLVWIPSVTDMYPPGFSTSVQVDGVSSGREGAHRPTHFRGVATVVTILLNAVGAARAYFGQKDAQQAAVIRRLALDLAIGTEIVICPTVRESDGLAMSSRNTYLDADQRAAAPVLYRALQAAQQRWQQQQGERQGPGASTGAGIPAEVLRSTVSAMLRTVVSEESIDYVSVAHPDTFDELDAVDSATGALVSTAVRFGSTRLIDNALLAPADALGTTAS
jgi:pantoate--beta-alanine ligase